MNHFPAPIIADLYKTAGGATYGVLVSIVLSNNAQSKNSCARTKPMLATFPNSLQN